MKSTGIVRKVDNLGRIVLPIELRRTLRMDIGDDVEIFVQNDRIVLKRYQSGCIFCGRETNLKDYCDQKVCSQCIAALNED